MLNLVKMQVPQRRKLLGKAHGICVIVQKYPVYFSPMVAGNSIYLVKLADGHKARDKQHEIQNVAADMAAGGSFLGCAGRCGGNADHADRAGGYAASAADCNRSRNGSGRERYAGFACAAGVCP